MTEDELRRLERSTYRAAADSGLWDMFLAGVLAMLAIGPLLSVRMGDFWASAVFVPIWVAALVAIRIVQARVVRPRLGRVEFAPRRKRRLASLGVVMLAVNLVAVVLGVVAAARVPTGGALAPLGLSLTLLVGFSTAAFFLEIPRVFGYGVLLAAAPPVGEALFQGGHASHHGFPVVFGVSALVVLLSGIFRFVRFLPPSRTEWDTPPREGNCG
jgi:hypothetical protein